VEFFLNLVWMILSAALVLLWIKGSRLAPDHSQQQNWKIQLLALAMLILILLPVISMTDDMHAMSTAEIEHVTRRADPGADQPADPIIPLNASLFPGNLCYLQTFARIEPSIQNARPQAGSVRQMANRPPPSMA
jgi:hypothetical protein